MNLQPYSEVVGILIDVKFENNHAELVFSIQKSIELPSIAISKEKLQIFLGQRVGIFNCGGNYKIRKITQEEYVRQDGGSSLL